MQKGLRSLGGLLSYIGCLSAQLYKHQSFHTQYSFSCNTFLALLIVKMHSVIAVVALAGLGAAQNLDIAAIQAAPSPAKTEAPVAAASDSMVYSPASASAVGADAIHHDQRGSMRKRQTTSGTVLGGTRTTMTTVKTTSSSTSSSTSACPTTPEAGTYCGFINPLDPCAIQPDGMYLHVFPFLRVR